MTRKYLTILVISIIATSCTQPPESAENELPQITANPTNKVVLSTEITWGPLNPARGDQSPQAGDIWGNRKENQATGFLVKFADGFSSPPHIHNITYRAIVLNGSLHNDDPDAQKMWMSTGSFWTQPAGEPHITAAQGEENMAYVEIDSGPYLVKPVEEAFDSGERPINLDRRNLVWLDASKTSLIEADGSATNPAIAFLWEDDKMTGNLIKFPAGFAGEIISEGKAFHAIVIAGELEYLMPQSGETKSLDQGSYCTSEGLSAHQIKVGKGLETLIYVRTNGRFTIK